MSDVFIRPENYNFLFLNTSILNSSILVDMLSNILFERISLRQPKRIISNNISSEYSDYGYLTYPISDVLSHAVSEMYDKKWSSYMDSIKETQYKEALNPFSITFTENKTGVLSSKDSGTRKSNSTGTDKTLTSKENTIEKKKPFNYNSDLVNASSSEVTFTDNNQNTGESSTTNSNDYSRNETETRHTSRKGNIGNHTIPQLLTEMNNFLSFNYVEMIINDLTDLLCQSVYY